VSAEATLAVDARGAPAVELGARVEQEQLRGRREDRGPPPRVPRQLLSLVASVQLTTNDLIRVGDWIEIPQFGAGADVVDIGLHEVKLQNWGRTKRKCRSHRWLSATCTANCTSGMAVPAAAPACPNRPRLYA
jgi:hypothetical protein